MGRGKIEIKRIENTSNRQVTYSKRRNGLIKKAKEITVLCDAHVSVIIFSSSNQMHNYCSPSSSIIQMLDRYHQHSGKKLWDAKHENLSNEIDRIKKENDSMQIELRHLNGEDITSLNYKELIAIEEGLDNGLANIRKKMSESYKSMKENELRLKADNEHLQYVYQQQMKAMDDKVRYIENEYNNQKMGNYEAQMPFAFRVQPNQPNLHEMILDYK